MRIAYPMRVDATDKPGGDVLQVLRYIEAGKRTGKDGAHRFEGVLMDDLHASLTGFDLIHLTNIDRPVDTYSSFLRAREAGKPIVLSSIHHAYEEIERFEREGRGGVVGLVSGALGFCRLEYLRSLLRSFHYPQLAKPTLGMLAGGMRESQQKVLAGVNRILVLTDKEKKDIIRNFGEIPEEKFACLRNGFEGEETRDVISGERDIDCCIVGRIEARKNQIAVLRVLERLGLRGVFVGGENQNHRGYCRRFRKMVSNSGSRYLGAITHAETLQVMRRARVHISASWFEVLSLVDLEAYWAGCGVVSSRCGGTREILGDEAEYVDPGSDVSIGEGVLKMLAKAATDGHGSGRRKTEVTPETWDDVGERLTDLYRDCVKKV
jgi:glycosyltransferase involved in cell wall biosynthesis